MRRMQISRIAIGVSLAGAALLGACSQDTATILDPLPNRAFNFVLTREGTNVPRGQAIASRSGTGVNTLEIRLLGLEKLEDPYFYQVWSADFNTTTNAITDYRRLGSSTVRVITTDTTISAAGDFVPATDTVVSTNVAGNFNEGGPGTIISLNVTAASLGEDPLTVGTGLNRLILVTIDSNPTAPTPPDEFGTQARLWARGITRPTTNGTSITTNFQFGNFHADPAQQYVFLAAGRGRGAVLENENILVVDDSSLSRPPVGYYYATALVTREDGDNFNNVDTIPLGPQHVPYPRRSTSLFNADIEQVDEVVQVEFPNPQIFAAQTRVDGDSVPGLATTGNPFRGVALILVTLESKFGTDAVSPVTILAGASPQGIRLRD